MMLKHKRTPSEWIKDNLPYILAFVIPYIVLSAIYIGREIFPYGDNMYLRSDCYHQYAPFYKELYRKITTGGSLTYSWNIGMGLNFTSLFAYYLASPMNLLLGFIPEGNVADFIGWMIVFKVALSCTTCSYYLSKKFDTKSLATVAFGLFYGFSSYMAAYSWNIMWLDCMILLPLIILGLERLVENNKCFLYCITLALAIFSNYYISIMLCIYMVIYFVYLLFTTKKKQTTYFVAKRVLNFIIYSLIAGGISACLLLPEIYTLGLSASSNFNFPDTLSNYFSILQMLSRNVMNMYVSVFDAHSPNLYFSVCVYLLLPLYCMCSKVSKKEKLGKVAMVIFFLFSFNLNIPNYVWHGFHYPNSLPCRESFIMIFLMITMCFEAAVHYKTYTDKQVFGSVAGSMALLIVIEQLYVGTNVFDESDKPYLFDFIYMSMAFILFYLIILVIARRKNIRRNFVIYLLFVVSIAEVAINTDETGYSTTIRSSYLNDNSTIEALIEKADEGDDSLFYRIEKLTRRTKNDGAWNGYRSVSTFSSTANASITETLGRLGFEKSTNAYSSYGLTPVTAGMLSIKYFVSSSVKDESKFLSLHHTEQKTDADGKVTLTRYLFKNNYWLPLGYMVDSDFIDNFSITGNNPFAVQNSYIHSALGVEELENRVFRQLEAVCVGSSSVEITVPTEEHVYVYVTSYVESISVSASSESDPDFTYSDSFSGLKHRQIVDLGVMPADTLVTVTTSDSVASLQLYAYLYDEEAYADVYKQLNDETLDITVFKDDYVKGTITAKEDGLMYTSINYDKGWTVYIDGKKAELESIHGAFIGVNVSAGTHTIEFRYTPVGLIPGLVITFVCIGTLAALIILDFRRKKTKQKKLAEAKDTDIIDYTVELDELPDEDNEDSDEESDNDSDEESDEESDETDDETVESDN